MSRLRFPLLVAAIAALAVALAACGSSGGGSDESPQTVLDDSTLEGIESADVDFTAGIDVSGDEGGHVDVEVSGPFQSGGGADQLPELDMTAEASGSVGGKDVDFEGGIVLVPNKAYVAYEGESYEVDPTTFSFVRSTIEEQQRKSGAESGTKGAGKCQEEAAGMFNVGDFVENLSNEGSADVGGTETTKVSGDLDVAGALEAVTELTEIPACSAQLDAAGPLPLGELEEAQGEIEKALKSAHAEVYVGDDNIVRRFTAQFEIKPQGSDEAVTVDLDLTLDGVNEDQEISTPDGAKPVSDLFEKLGINPIELLQGAQGGAGLGGLLEQFGGAAESELPGIGSSGGGGGKQSEYLDCVRGASTPVDLQNCTKKLQ